MNPKRHLDRETIALDRRGFLAHSGGGFRALALAHLLATQGARAGSSNPAHPPALPRRTACITGPAQQGRSTIHVRRGQPVRYVRLQTFRRPP